MPRKILIPKFTNSLYLNANLIYSTVVSIIKKKEGKTLFKLSQKYELVTSSLTKFDVIQNLRLVNGLKIEKARNFYNKLENKYEISHITSLNKINLLTDDYLDRLSKTNIKLNDGLHLEIASFCFLPVCTHDKKMLKASNQHQSKKKLYSQVFKPSELI